ncbi:hypothetical protein [Acaryochloris thomasi]|uniref:hypothetical protein n=1 Tax=Acaryochloris thomasi TaxID=2929456 RepID=UPI0011B4E37F|nr:hypothetical protein [Acaryochloris thomasi]
MLPCALSQRPGPEGREADDSLFDIVVDDTAIAAGYGTGGIAQLILSGQFTKPGVWPVEASLPTNFFQKMLSQRGISVTQKIAKS